MNALLPEIAAGTVAVLSGVTAAFLFASGSGDSVLLYLLVSGLVLLAAAGVLLLRLQQYNAGFARHLLDQLPGEVACRLRGQGVTRISASELVDLLGDYIRDQQALLNLQFSQNILERPSMQHRVSAETMSSPVPDDDQLKLQVLRAELNALEDQFATDLQQTDELRQHGTHAWGTQWQDNVQQ